MTLYEERKSREVQELMEQCQSLGLPYTFTVEVINENYYVVFDKYTIQYNEYQKVYWINRKNRSFPDYTSYTDYGNLKKPNDIHKLRASAVEQWVKYWDEVEIVLNSLSIERTAKVEQFLSVATTAQIPFKRDDNAIRGRKVTNGIEYSFEIDSRSGYISERIELNLYATGRKTSIDTFLRLAENGIGRE